MKKITEHDVMQKFGINTAHHQMQNGEFRFRLIDNNGIGYVRTHSGDIGSWQNSHFHIAHAETYIVQRKWIMVATLSPQNDLMLLPLEEGEIWTSDLRSAHNVFMPAGAITHTIKHGSGSSQDWHTNCETEMLDQKSKILNEKNLQKFRSH